MLTLTEILGTVYLKSRHLGNSKYFLTITSETQKYLITKISLTANSFVFPHLSYLAMVLFNLVSLKANDLISSQKSD